MNEDDFPEQERRGIRPLPAFDPDKAYDERRDRLMEQYEYDRQREAEGSDYLTEEEPYDRRD